MFPPDLIARAEVLLKQLRRSGLTIVTAESCTGGLIVGLLTEIAGSSDVVDRGYITYSNAAKTEALGVPATLITQYGAVSADVAIAMAEGALAQSGAHVAVAVTGVAGPGGGTTAKPVGLVHIAAVRRGAKAVHRECRFGDLGRSAVRLATVDAALALLQEIVAAPAA